MIGTDAERGGILQGYEGVVTRLARATVPKIAVVVRKAYGGGHIALGGRPVKPDLLFAWPTAEMGFMAPDTGVRTVYRRRLERGAAEHGAEAPTRRRRARGRVGRRVRAVGGRGAHHPGRRDRSGRHPAGRSRRASTSRGAAGSGRPQRAVERPQAAAAIVPETRSTADREVGEQARELPALDAAAGPVPPVAPDDHREDAVGQDAWVGTRVDPLRACASLIIVVTKRSCALRRP